MCLAEEHRKLPELLLSINVYDESRSHWATSHPSQLRESGIKKNSPNINTYNRRTVVIQDKSKTRFGKWIHDVAYSFVLNISYGLQSAAADTTVGVLLRPLTLMRRIQF